MTTLYFYGCTSFDNIYHKHFVQISYHRIDRWRYLQLRIFIRSEPNVRTTLIKTKGAHSTRRSGKSSSSMTETNPAVRLVWSGTPTDTLSITTRWDRWLRRVAVAATVSTAFFHCDTKSPTNKPTLLTVQTQRVLSVCLFVCLSSEAERSWINSCSLCLHVTTIFRPQDSIIIDCVTQLPFQYWYFQYYTDKIITLWRPLLSYRYRYKAYCARQGTLTLSPERQSARMSKMTNDGCTRSGRGCFIARTYMTAVGINEIKSFFIWILLSQIDRIGYQKHNITVTLEC